MKKSILLVLVLVHVLYACTDDYSKTFQYVVENELSTKTNLILYDDSEFQEELKTIILNPGDSLVIYECSNPKSGGLCSPFDGDNYNEIQSNFGSIIFDDGKRLDFQRSLDSEFNLFFDYRYDTFIRPSDRLRIAVFTIDATEYLLAE